MRRFLQSLAVVLASALALIATEPVTIRLVPVSLTCGSPIAIACAPGDNQRLFICDSGSSSIKAVDRSTGAATVYLAPQMVATGGESGVLGVAFHPQFATNGYLYVFVVTQPDMRTEIRRYTAIGTPATSTAADPDSRTLILSHPHAVSYHRGGWLAFGADGYLYASIGDGGQPAVAQDLTDVRGKILRIDVDTPAPGLAYGIPADNPFANHPTNRQEILHFGLRNPWRCSFDRANGDLWIGDVGEYAREEVIRLPAHASGRNCGWPRYEGTIINSGFPEVTDHTPPAVEFPRDITACIIGGYVYRGSAEPELVGRYIGGSYGDLAILHDEGSWSQEGHLLVCPTGAGPWPSGEVTVLAEPIPETSSDGSLFGKVVTFGEDAQGELYVGLLGKGLYRLAVPLAVSVPTPVLGKVGEPLAVTWIVSGQRSPVTWQVTSGPLPSGLSLLPGGVISGVPTGHGAFTITLQASENAHRVGSASATLMIDPSLDLDFDPGQIPVLVTGQPFRLTAQVSYDGSPLSMELRGASLPTGLRAALAGSRLVISGTPTAAIVTTDHTMVFSDVWGERLQPEVAFRLHPLPNGVRGQRYDVQIPLAGGDQASSTFAVTAGSLPAGLVLSTRGRLSGTPTASGSMPVTVTVTPNPPALPVAHPLVVTVTEPVPSSGASPTPSITNSEGGAGGCGAGGALGLVVAGLVGLRGWRRRSRRQPLR
jgi:glucose/arabinose dehydrogenase